MEEVAVAAAVAQVRALYMPLEVVVLPEEVVKKAGMEAIIVMALPAKVENQKPKTETVAMVPIPLAASAAALMVQKAIPVHFMSHRR